jgi:hypothetical protein
MGYEGDADRDPGRQLLDEFTTRTQHVRAFIQKHFGHDVAETN